MSATIAPSSFLPGIKKFTSAGDGSAAASTFGLTTNYFAIPLTALPELTFADTDPSTGDIRKIIYAMEVALFAAYTALADANKPAQWVPGTSTSSTTAGVVKRTYRNQFTTTFTGETVAPE